MTKLLPICLLLLMTAPAFAADAPGRWPVQKADDWAGQQPWFCGFNYIPANAINSTEMWAAGTFSPDQIERELTEAQKVGFDCARVFVQYIIWEQDPAGLHKRIDTFLEIAARHGIKVMFVPFDDCYFGHQGPEPIVGKQPDPIPGEYASGFTSSPGPKRVGDPAYWPRLHDYVTDLLTWYKNDPRVFMWDLYNECTNSGMGTESLPLLRAEWEWARAVNPSQPLTMCYWTDGSHELNRFIFENVDVVTFHNYSPGPELRKEIAQMKSHGRPVICTEWLNRPQGSVVAEELPIFAELKVGCIHWGLVNGKTQTNYRWGSKAGDPPPKVWQHDLFHTDLTPYDAKELAVFHELIERMDRK
jgi:hypothetical protein